jgi:phage tail protein X
MASTFLVPQGYVWDQISYVLYKDEGFIHALLAANPTLRHIVVFEDQQLINVPDKPVTRAASSATLPPWKRGK